MITLHVAKLLENEGFGVIDTDIFWEEIPIATTGKAKEGIWIVSRAPAVSRVDTGIQNFDIYARYSSKITTSKKLEDILIYLQQAYETVCDLPTVPEHNSDTLYTNVSIQPTSGIGNVGTDDNEKIVKVISGEVRFSIGE